MSNDSILTERTAAVITHPLQRWGGAASIVMASAFIAAPLIYLTGNLRDPLGALTYSLADLLYGPVWGVCLVVSMLALRERIGAAARGRMSVAVPVAIAAAAVFLAVALIRAANREYHITHPELGLENNISVLVVWTTFITGLTGAGWHLLGWTWILTGWAGWSSRLLPRPLSLLYVLTGILSLSVYLQPNSDLGASLPGAVLALWQGIVLLSPPPARSDA